MTLASPSKLSLERWSRLAAGPPLVRFARPSADKNRVRQLPGASSLRHGAATRRTCSARVVSHHLDGLLRTRPRGLVASRSRPGVRRVSGAPEPVPSCPTEVGQTRWRTSDPLSRDAGFHTLRRVSSSTAGTASPRSVAFLPLPALVPPRPQPKPRHARWVLANQEPRGHRRPEPGRPAGTGHRLDTVKLRSAANGGPPRHRVVQAPANRCAARADRPADSAEARTNERSSPGRSGMPARRIAGGRHGSTRGCPARRPTAETARPLRCTPDTPKRTGRTLRDDASGRLQGLAPSTSPWCCAAVAGGRTPDPSMGFVPLQGPLALRSTPGPCRDRADTAGRSPGARDADRGLRPVRHRWDPSDDCPSHAPPKRGERDGPGGRSRPRSTRLFSAPSAARVVPRTLGAAEAVLEKRGGVAGVCPEARS
jgi:hypothetical protein